MQFLFLRLRQIGGVITETFPVAAGILHIRVEHQLKQVITQIIMFFADNPRPFFGLQITQTSHGDFYNIVDILRQFIFQPARNTR